MEFVGYYLMDNQQLRRNETINHQLTNHVLTEYKNCCLTCLMNDRGHHKMSLTLHPLQ